jgi:hypothetical protein
MTTLRIKAVKKPIQLKHLGLALLSIWGGRVYGAEDVVPVKDANYALLLMEKRSKNQ